METASKTSQLDTPATSDPSWWRLVKSDVVHHAREAEAFQGDRPGMLRSISILLTPSLLCCALHRLGHATYRRGWISSSCAIAWINEIVHHTVIDPAAEIGPGLYIPHTTGVVFRGTAGANLSLYSFAIVGPLEPMPFPGGVGKLCPRIGNNVSIGAFAMVLGPILVGDRSRVGPHVVVTSNVVPDSALMVHAWCHAAPGVAEI